MKAAVIVFPGSNCDRDVQVALRASMGREPAMVWHGDRTVPEVDLIVVPGGFSYGDYLRCGAMAAHSPVMQEVGRRAQAGVAVLGICNGFQVLTEAGLLPGVLLANANLKFICRDVHVRVEDTGGVFTAGLKRGEALRMPIAHHGGNYYADDNTLCTLEGEGRIAFRYSTPSGEVTAAANPNGSFGNIAGIYNERRNILGLMPHPERLAEPALGGTDGKRMLDGLVAALS